MIINKIEVAATKNEAKEAIRLQGIMHHDKAHAQRSADIWMRSAPNKPASERRKAIASALGLSDVVTFA